MLVVTAHPDDAEIGMGGTIARLSKRYEVDVFILSVPNATAVRYREAGEAAEMLQTNVRWWPPAVGKQLDEIPEHHVVEAVEAVIGEARPWQIYTHWIVDGHQEHQIVARATLAASRLAPMADVYMFGPTNCHVPHASRFSPTMFVDITDTSEQKWLAIELHQSQVARPRMADLRSQVLASERWNGAHIGVEAAEGFEIVRRAIGPDTPF